MVGITSGNTLALEFFRQRPDVGGRGTAQGRPTSGADNTEIAERTAKVGALVATSNAASGDTKPVRTFQGQPLTNQSESLEKDADGKDLTVAQSAAIQEQELSRKLGYVRQSVTNVNAVQDALKDPKLSAQEVEDYKANVKAGREILEANAAFLRVGFDVQGKVYEELEDGKVKLGDFTARYVGDGFSISANPRGIASVILGERANPRGQGVDLRL